MSTPVANEPEVTGTETQPVKSSPGWSGTIPLWRALVVLVLGGLAAVICVWGSGDVNNTTEAGVIMNLPEWVGGMDYMGKDAGVSDSEKTILPKDTEFERKEYTSTLTGEMVNCQIVLSGGEKRSIHRPEICLPGQGWTVKTGGAISIPMKNGSDLKAMKLLLSRPVQVGPNEKRNLQSIFLYWFVGKDKITPQHYERILLTSWDRVFHNTNHRWAYVVVSAPITASLNSRGKNEAETQAMLEKFVADVAPEILKPEVLPGGAKAQ